jgi:hypothetical protein
VRHEHLNGIASLAMNSPLDHSPPHHCVLALTNFETKAIELLSILLADIADDIEVAARDQQISDASFVRLRRAMDRVACAQSVLESMRVGRKTTRCWRKCGCRTRGSRSQTMELHYSTEPLPYNHRPTELTSMSEELISLAEAAQLLFVARTHIANLIDEGKLTARDGMLRRSDVLEYKSKQRAAAEAFFATQTEDRESTDGS